MNNHRNHHTNGSCTFRLTNNCYVSKRFKDLNALLEYVEIWAAKADGIIIDSIRDILDRFLAYSKSWSDKKICRTLASCIHSIRTLFCVVQNVGNLWLIYETVGKSCLHFASILLRYGTLLRSSRITSCKLWVKHESRRVISSSQHNSSASSSIRSVSVNSRCPQNSHYYQWSLSNCLHWSPRMT